MGQILRLGNPPHPYSDKTTDSRRAEAVVFHCPQRILRRALNLPSIGVNDER